MQLVRAEQQAKYGVAAKTAPAPEAESLRFSQQEIASLLAGKLAPSTSRRLSKPG